MRLIETEPVKMKGTADTTQVGPAQEMPSGAVRMHAVQAEDTIRKLAEQYYTDSTKWPKIWFANRDKLPNPILLVPGTRLVIPSDGPLTEEERTLLNQKDFPEIP